MKTAVLFDLDGTLTDPKPGITRCISHALERLGHAPVPSDDLTWCIGPPLADSFPELLKSDDPALVTLAISHYRERFADVGLYENAVYEGVPEVLSCLRERGLRLFVATSKPLSFAERILDHFGLDGYFERTFGSSLDGSMTDKGELLRHALQETGLFPREAIMVGDRRHDVHGARVNGLPCLGVLYGYGSREELTEAGAVALCDSPTEITSRLETIGIGREPNAEACSRR